MLIALDFDGTLVENHPDFPSIGDDNGAGPWLAQAAAAAEEVRFALYTVRTGEAYEAAAAWCRQHLADLPWLSPQPPVPPLGVKLRAQLYIDDKALGAPLKVGRNGRPCVDWDVAGPLMMREIYRRKQAAVPAAAQELVACGGRTEHSATVSVLAGCTTCDLRLARANLALTAAERDKAKKALADLYELRDLLACVSDEEAWGMAVAYTAELSRQHDADCDVVTARRERDAAIAERDQLRAQVVGLEEALADPVVTHYGKALADVERLAQNLLRTERDVAIADAALLRAAGNALAEDAYHEQKRGFTADCEPTCRVCAWNKVSP